MQAIQEAFPFSVDKFPLTGPEGMRTDVYGLFRSDNSQFVGRAVKKNYVQHTTDDVEALAEAATTLFGGDHDIQCHWRDGHIVSMRPPKEFRLSVFGTNDNIYPVLKINAGYDGQAFSATLGFFRDVCRNMSRMKFVEGTSTRIRHDSNLRDKMDVLIQDFQALSGGWDNLTEYIRRMEQTPILIGEFLDQIYGQPKPDAPQREVTIHKNRTVDILNRLIREQSQTGRPAILTGGKASAWMLSNAVQGYVQWDSTRKGANDTPFDRIILAERDKGVIKSQEIIHSLVSV